MGSVHQREHSRVTSCSGFALAIATGERFAARSARSVRRPQKLSIRSFPISFPQSITAKVSPPHSAPMRCAAQECCCPEPPPHEKSSPNALTAMGATRRCRRCLHKCYPDRRRVAYTRNLRGKPTWITFTSGSTVKNWLALAGRESLEGVRIASIGPATSEVIRKHGLQVDAEATPSTMDGLVDAITRYSLSLRGGGRDYPERGQRGSSST